MQHLWLKMRTKMRECIFQDGKCTWNHIVLRPLWALASYWCKFRTSFFSFISRLWRWRWRKDMERSISLAANDSFHSHVSKKSTAMAHLPLCLFFLVSASESCWTSLDPLQPTRLIRGVRSTVRGMCCQTISLIVGWSRMMQNRQNLCRGLIHLVMHGADSDVAVNKAYPVPMSATDGVKSTMLSADIHRYSSQLSPGTGLAFVRLEQLGHR